MIKKVIFFALMPVFFLNALASELLVADYEQVKTMVSFGASIKSRGQVFVNQDCGVLWSQQTPLQVKTKIDNQSVTTVTQGGASNRVDIKNVTDANAIPTLIKALLESNDKEMHQYFSVRSQEKREQMEVMILEPKNEFLKRLFLEIELVRDKTHVKNVTFKDSSGDITVIHFSNVRIVSVNSNELRTQFDLK